MPSLAAVLKRVSPGLQWRQWPNWGRRSLTRLIVVFGLFGLVTYFFAPGWIKSLAEQAVQEEIGRKLTLGDIRINPYTLSATVRDIRLFEVDGTTTALQVDEIEVNASSASLFHRAAVLDELRVVHPVMHITRIAPQRFSFSDIVDKILAKPKSEDPVHFSLNNIQVENGEIDFDDRVTGQRHRIDALKLALPFISDLPHATDIFVEPAFEARIDGSPIELTAKSKPFAGSLDSSLELEMNDIDLPGYMGFSPVPLNFKLASGKLSTNLALSFRRSQQTELTLTGQTTISSLRLTDHMDQDVLSFQALTVVLDRVDLIRQNAAIQRIQIDAPELHVMRGKNGAFNLEQVFAPATGTRTTSAASSKKPAAPAAKKKIDIAQIIINRGSIHWNDQALDKPFQTRINDIQLNIGGLSTHRTAPAQIKLALQTANEERIEQQGTLSLASKNASGQFKFQQLKPGQYVPYTAPFLLARIEQGSVDISGRYAADWVNPEIPQFKLDELALTVNKLRLRMPDDKEALLAGEQFSLSGGHFDLAANTLSIENVKLVAPSIGVKRGKDGRINLLTMMPASPLSGPDSNASSAIPAKAAMSMLVKALQVEHGSVRFDDAAAPTPVSLRADDLDLSAQNISNIKGANIPFDLKTGFNRKGQLNLKGSAVLEPLAVTASIDARKLGIASLQGYAADRLNVNIVNADLSLRGNARFAMSTPDAFSAAFKGTADLNDVTALDRVNDDEFLRFKALKLGQIDVQLPARAPLVLTLTDIALSDFYARVIVNSNGTINLQQVVQSPEEAEAGQKSITTAQTSDQAAAKPAVPAVSPIVQSATSTPENSAPKPVIRLGQITLINGQVNFTDNLIRPNYSANLTGLGGSISGMASDQPAPADLNIRGSIDGDGALTINGKINPLGAQLYTDIAASASDIELTKLTAYAVKYAGYAIEKGKLSMKVQYKIENGKLDAQNNLYLDQLTFGQRVESPTATSLPVLLAVSLLKDSNGVIDINLPVSGSLSDPEFSMGGVIVRVIINLLTKALISPFSLLASAFGGEDELGYIEFASGSAMLSGSDQAKIEKLAKALADRPGLKLDITGRADPETDREGARRERLAEKVRAQKIRDVRSDDKAVDRDTIKVDASEYPKYLERVYSNEKFSKPRNIVGIAKTLPVEEMEKLILANTNISDEDLRALANQRADKVRKQIEKIEPKLGERVFLVAPKLGVEGIKDKGKPNRADFSLH